MFDAMRRVIPVGVVLVGIGPLAGCYQTEQPLFDRGEKVAQTGEADCTDTLDSDKVKYSHVSFREIESKVGGYEYMRSFVGAPDKEALGPMLFIKMNDSFYLVQDRRRNHAPEYYYFKVENGKYIFKFFSESLSDSDKTAIEGKYGIQFGYKNALPFLGGDNANIKRFLLDYGARSYRTVMSCVPIGSSTNEYVRRQICDPVIQDAFAKEVGARERHLSDRLVDSCNKCFAHGLQKELPPGEQYALDLTLTGRSSEFPLDEAVILAAQKRYDELFASCSRRLVTEMTEALGGKR